jgi:hypothetical protein
LLPAAGEVAGTVTSGLPRAVEETPGVVVEARAVEETPGAVVEARAVEATAGATVEARLEVTVGVTVKVKAMEEALPHGQARAVEVTAGATAEAKAEARVVGLETASTLTPSSGILPLSVTSLSLQSVVISRKSSKAMATLPAASATWAAHL